MVSLADVESAAKRLEGKLSRTPVARSALLSERLGRADAGRHRLS